jgi:hypothetical protein
MTKKELYTKSVEIMDKYGINAECRAELVELLEPKKGGVSSINIEEITETDANGNITSIKCALCDMFLPATLEYFYEDKDSKIVNAEGIGLNRKSRQDKQIKREAERTYKASKEAIVTDLLDGNISQEEAKSAIDGLSVEPDYSTIEVA